MNISTQKDKSFVSKGIGVFSISLLTAVSAVYIYSPVIGVNADTTANVDVNATVAPIASLSVDNSSLSFNIVPTASGSFDSDTITATIDTNSTGGYELYFSSEDNNTAMTHSDSNISNTIASDFSGTVTSSTMAANKWGYSLDNTNFSKIPAANAQATIKNIDHYPSAAEKTSTVRIGMKLDTTLPSGTYSKNVKFSVLAHATPPTTISSISSMQKITSDICTNSSVNESNTLTDTRDGNTYTVKKLKDGNCWMTQNLRIGGNTAVTLHPSDSDVASDFTIPASNVSSFGTTVDTKAAYVDSTHGGYYNYYTASAGEGGSSNSSRVEHSICPKGWRLPTINELYALYTNHYHSSALMQGEPGFTLSGIIYHGNFSVQGTYAHVWASTIRTVNDAFYLNISTTDVDYDWHGKEYGVSVRCVAR